MRRLGEEVDTGSLCHLGGLQRGPKRRQIEQTLGSKEGCGDFGKPDAFFFGQFKGVNEAQPVDQTVGDAGGEDFAAQAVRADIFAEGIAHLRREGCQQIIDQGRIIDHA